jgi:hypothetical protein
MKFASQTAVGGSDFLLGNERTPWKAKERERIHWEVRNLKLEP